MMKKWAELTAGTGHETVMRIMAGRVVGVDGDDNDIVEEKAVIFAGVIAPPAGIESVLLDEGYRPLQDTVAFDGDLVTFLVEDVDK